MACTIRCLIPFAGSSTKCARAPASNPRYNWAPPMPDPTTCKHARTQLIAKDQDAEYVECLDCGTILEAEELGEPSGFDESLSDA